MHRHEPLVSVVIPVFNGGRTLAKTLASAAGQTYANLEIIVVDDGSTDDSVAIADAFARSDRRVRVVRQLNGGVASARNSGLACASGDFVAPLDADDLWHATKVGKQVAAIHAGGDEVAFVYCGYRMIDEQDRVIWSLMHDCRGPVLLQHLFTNFVGSGSNALFRIRAVREAGGYDAGLRAQQAEGSEDYLLQLQLSSRYRVEVVQEYLVGYRVSAGSMSTKPQKMLKSSLHVAQAVHRACPDVPEFVFKWNASEPLVRAAQGFLKQRRVGSAARLLVTALRHDALGMYIAIHTKLTIFVARRLRRGTRCAALGRHFDAYSATEVFDSGYSRLYTRRLAYLRRLDQQLIDPRPSARIDFPAGRDRAGARLN